MSWIRHPGSRRLERLADGECPPEEARRIREHLAECARCRRDFSFLRALERTVREIPAPRPPPGTLEEALTRREAGERRILPTADPPPARRRARSVVAAAGLAGLVAAAAALFFLTAGEAAAGASELRIAPDALLVPGPLPVEYRAASALAAEERLRLRVRYRFADDPPLRLSFGRPLAADLRRNRPGRFEGALQLPRSAVYAVFSVEDPDGREVDANGGRLWEVLARDEAGRPTFAALQERLLVMGQIRRELALATAVEITELYPERIDGWVRRLYYEGLLLDRERRDGLRAEHRQRLAEFERRVAGAPAPSADDLAALVHYARNLEDEDAVRRWTERLEDVAPAHRVAVQERVVAVLRAEPDDPIARLRMLEEEWERSGPADELLLQVGFQAALAGKDARAILAWAHRIDRYAPHWTHWVALRLVEQPVLRGEGIERLRRELRRLEATGPEVRPLDRSIPEHRADARREGAPLLAALGRALVAEGDTSAALDTLSVAAERAWDPPLFEELAELRLAGGDTSGAIELRAFAAADPLTKPVSRAALRLGPGPAVERQAWAQRLDEAREELGRRAREARVSRPVPPDIRVADGRGSDRRLSELLAGGPVLVLYWAHFPHTARRDVSELRDEAERVAAVGGRLLAVTGRERSPELEAFVREEDLGVPVVFDDHGEVGHRLELRGRVRYLVIDDAGRVRFRERDLREALRHFLLLSEGTPRMSSSERTGP